MVETETPFSITIFALQTQNHHYHRHHYRLSTIAIIAMETAPQPLPTKPLTPERSLRQNEEDPVCNGEKELVKPQVEIMSQLEMVNQVERAVGVPINPHHTQTDAETITTVKPKPSPSRTTIEGIHGEETIESACIPSESLADWGTAIGNQTLEEMEEGRWRNPQLHGQRTRVAASVSPPFKFARNPVADSRSEQAHGGRSGRSALSKCTNALPLLLFLLGLFTAPFSIVVCFAFCVAHFFSERVQKHEYTNVALYCSVVGFLITTLVILVV